MPRLAKKRPTRRMVYNDHHFEALTTGYDWWHSFRAPGAACHHVRSDDSPENSEFAAKREAWAELADEIMPEWIEARPFTRPWAWWKFSAPERRQCINGDHPHDNPAWPIQYLRKSLTFGTPNASAAVPGDFRAKY